MGACVSRTQRKHDHMVERTAAFVRFGMQGDLVNLKLMLQQKMNPNAQDRFGMTALHWASYTGKLMCVQELINANASPSIVDSNGRNALHHACRKDQVEIVRYLLDVVKMDINARSESKETPLHKAVRGKSIKCIGLLLQRGADPSLRNDQNRTPLEELDASIDTSSDDALQTISTARVEEWRQYSTTPVTEIAKVTKQVVRRDSDGFYRSSSDESGDNTPVMHFTSLMNEQSCDHVDKRTDSCNSWSSSKSVTAEASATSASNQPAPVAALTRLDLANLTQQTTVQHWVSTRTSSGTSVESITPETVMDRDVSRLPVQKKTLKYGGKRVIMILRAKKFMSGDEKRELICHLFAKYAKSFEDTVNTTTSASPSLQRQVSDLTLSLSLET